MKGEKNKMNEKLERQIIQLVATDRISIPIKSMSGKLDRAKPKLAKAIALPESFYNGDRVYARVVDEEGTKARGMKDAIEVFSVRHPQYGKELQGLIAEQRTLREPTLYFGMQPESRLTSDDYMSVMTNLGFSEAKAENMYTELMYASRRISKTRDEERSILVG
jgi:hypothetical protein